ncbi:uncharacterized protein [Clytia hemisphaerica]|uniref:Protein phosphatase 1 regulatory subunit 35 C-terminal domain-containing protein n=1 Tax=Clytia hemisphaerica TaxID=252671 RepID=A0A7M5XLH1_9CNID
MFLMFQAKYLKELTVTTSKMIAHASLEPSKPPVPSLPTVKVDYRVDNSLDITPVKVKPAKKVSLPKKTESGNSRRTTSKKKVEFIVNNYPSESIQENSLANPTLHTTNLLKKQLDACVNQEFDYEKTLKEIELSDSFNTRINEEMTCLLNYKLHDQKYTNLTSIKDDSPDLKSIAVQRKTLYKPRKKKIDTKPDLKDFYEEENFITEKPCTDFGLDFDEDFYGNDTDNENELDNDYLFYMYRKYDLGSSYT